MWAIGPMVATGGWAGPVCEFRTMENAKVRKASREKFPGSRADWVRGPIKRELKSCGTDRAMVREAGQIERQ